jgi:hypothetical protein
VRRARLAEQADADPARRAEADPLDPDSDEALAAYNRMLGRLHDHE